MAIYSSSLTGRRENTGTAAVAGWDLEWTCPIPGVWCATGPAGLVGIVERSGALFEARSTFGEVLGWFDSLHEAQSAVVGADRVAHYLTDRLAPLSVAAIALTTVTAFIAFALAYAITLAMTSSP